MVEKEVQQFIEYLKHNGYSFSDSELAVLKKEARVHNYKKREVVFSQAVVAGHIGIVIDGVLASEFINNDESSISRFFCEGDLCANLESAFQSEYAFDTLFAITQAKVLTLPFKRFEQMYLGSENFGLYLRKQLLLNTLTTKKIVSIKSQSAAQAKQEILEKDLPWVLERVPQKYIASFLGLTPQGYSRFLRGKSSK
ncbi:Crp/Fnr family transcriptional regulator [Vibrio owensii]|uniref:Crp/Fnr family transcriptional regulator n=1 Tax=Vibrio owensii TaxID=696485 RepID=UPI0018F1C79E|nr:Crp/Fnr family transcriptional regulator [Vibrio owensii]